MQPNSCSLPQDALRSVIASQLWAMVPRISLCVAMLLNAVASGCTRQSTSLTSSHAPSSPDLTTAEQSKPPVLIIVSISPESRVKATAEDIAMELHQGAWRDFLIEIDNAAGITAPLIVESQQILQSVEDTSRDRWLQIELAPQGSLSGSKHEVRTLRLKSRDSGIRTAILNFNAGQGTQDLGFRSDVLVTFKVYGE